MNRRVFGIDFSGAKDAGRLIWIAEVAPTPRGLRILSCLPAQELPGGATDREMALAALRRFISAQDDAIFGCDFPFSLPNKVLRATNWDAFIANFDHPDPDSFRKRCRRLSPHGEPKRPTDEEAKTPWCAFNIRLYRQTYWGLAGVLRPLVLGGKAKVLPMQQPVPGRAWMIETCPASVLKRLDRRASYKGVAHADARRAILEFLCHRGHLVRPAPETADRLIENSGGDALDSVIAALATAAALEDIQAGRGNGDPIEGRVYFRV